MDPYQDGRDVAAAVIRSTSGFVGTKVQAGAQEHPLPNGIVLDVGSYRLVTAPGQIITDEYLEKLLVGIFLYYHSIGLAVPTIMVTKWSLKTRPFPRYQVSFRLKQ